MPIGRFNLLASAATAREHAAVSTALFLVSLLATATSTSTSSSTPVTSSSSPSSASPESSEPSEPSETSAPSTPPESSEPSAASTVTTPASSSTTPTAAAATVTGRIFFSPLRAGEGVDETTRQLIEDAILVAARKRDPRVIGSADLVAILSVEATRQTMGCSTTGCDAELADALGAPELLSGQLSHTGDTWVLSMSRLEREALTVIARHQVNRTGSSGTVLLEAVPEVVDALFGIEPTTWSPAFTAGAVAAGTGAGVAAVGSVLYLVSFLNFQTGEQAVRDNDLQKAAGIRETYEPLSNVGLAAVGVGAAGFVVGAVVLGLGLASEQP